MSDTQSDQGFQFENLAELTNREIQMILRETNFRDVVTALQGASETLIGRILGNMSERVGTMLREEMAIQEMRTGDVENARLQMVKVVAQLSPRGQITWPRPEARPPARPLPEEHVAMKARLKDRLQETSFSAFGPEDITELLASLAETARREGVLALQPLAEACGEGLLRQGLGLVIDGVEPALARTILKTRTETLMQHHRTRCRMILEGVMLVQRSANPHMVEEILRAFYMVSEAQRDGYTDASVDDLAARLQATPFSELDLDGVTDAFVDMAILSRQEGLAPLKALVAFVDDKPLADGLELASDGTEPELIQTILEMQIQTLLHHHKTKCRMVTEGVLSIQSGDNPRIIEQKMRTFYEV